MVDTHKIIAVYGNSGSYKTATSISLAKAIINANKEASVAVIGLDHTKPLNPLLFPGKDSNASLGKLLSSVSLEQETIMKQLNMNESGVSKGLCVLGYNSGENYLSYAAPTGERIDDFFMQIRHLVNYAIVDCTSDVTYKMTAKSLIMADNTLFLISCDINGLVFYQSQEPILLGEQYGYNNYLRFLTVSGRFIQDEKTMQNVIPQIDGIIPYSENISEKWNNGEMLSDIHDAAYNSAIDEIADMVMEV